MQNNDAALIHRVLAGDDTAFTTLMERKGYPKNQLLLTVFLNFQNN